MSSGTRIPWGTNKALSYLSLSLYTHTRIMHTNWKAGKQISHQTICVPRDSDRGGRCCLSNKARDSQPSGTVTTHWQWVRAIHLGLRGSFSLWELNLHACIHAHTKRKAARIMKLKCKTNNKNTQFAVSSSLCMQKLDVMQINSSPGSISRNVSIYLLITFA